MSTTVTESKRHLEINATEFDGQLDGTIKSNTTATTQSAGDNSTKVATTAYADAILPSWVPSSNPNYLTGYTVTQSDVTAHQAALSITESQISDLQSYLTAVPSGYATESYVQTQITNLVDSAPSTLNTLDELALALGDDPNFATTIATTIGTKLPKGGGIMTGDIILNDNVELEFGTGSDVKMKFDGSDLITTVPSGSAFMIGTNGGTPHDNSGKADFVVDVNANPQISLYSDQVQIGGTDMNWSSKFYYSGTTNIASWNTDINIFTQGSSGGTAKNINIKPQAADGVITTVAQFNGDTGTTLTGTTTINGATTITHDNGLFVKSTTNGGIAQIKFSDASTNSYDQVGHIKYQHGNSASYGGGDSFTIGGTETTTVILADGQLMYKDGIYSKPSSGTGAGTRKDANWDTAYTHSQSTHAPTNADATPSWVPSSNPNYLTSVPAQTWASITGKPSTFTPSAHNQAWSTITSTPTTISGYGITDAFDGAYGSLTGTPTIPTDFVSAANGGTFSGDITADNITSTSNGGNPSIYINSTRPTLGFTDSNSFADANDIYLIRGTSGPDLSFQFYDDSASTTTETFNIDSTGNATFAGGITAKDTTISTGATVSLANQPSLPLNVSNGGVGVDGRVFINVKHDSINTASAPGAGLQMQAGAVTSGTASYFSSQIFLQSAGQSNSTIHSAPKDIKFYVDNHGTAAGAGSSYNAHGDLALTLDENANATFAKSGTFADYVHWDLSSGEYSGDPRALVTGYSGSNYGGIGYNIAFNSNGTHQRVFNDIPTWVNFHNGLVVYASAAGSAGSTITWTEILEAQTDAFQYKGQDIYHTGNLPTIPSISGLASTSYVDTAVANLIDSAPANLNTLNELAEALNDDDDAIVTINTALGTKLPLAGGTMSGQLIVQVSTSNNQLKLKRTTSATGEFNIFTNNDTLFFNNVANNSYPLKLGSSDNAIFAGSITTDRLSLFTSNTDRATIQAGSSGTTGHLYLNSYEGSDLHQLTWSGANNGFYPQGSSGTFSLGLNGNRWSNVYTTALTASGEIEGGSLDINGNAAINGKVVIEGDSAAWNTSAPGTTTGSLHFDPGVNTDHYGNAITFGASDSGNGATAQAGIYLRTDGSYGSRMYFATTDSYNSGSKIAMYINHNKDVYFNDDINVAGNIVVSGTVDGVDISALPTSFFDGAYGSLSGVPSTFTPSSHTHTFGSLTSKPTTLSGYGITDAAADNAVVKLTGNQTIAGNKTFSGQITANNSIYLQDGDGIYITGQTYPNLTLSGDEPTLSSAQGDTCYLSDNVRVNGDLTVNGGDITLNGTGKITGIDTVTAATHAANKSYVDTQVATRAASSHTHAYNTLTGIPSTFTPSSHTHTFGSLTSKPTTISGYGITDAFNGAYGSLSGTPTIPSGNQIIDWTANGAGTIHSSNYTNSQYTKASFDLDHLFTLVGAAADTSTNMGSYTSQSVPQNQTIKQNINALSTRKENFIVACSDETSDLTTGTSKVTFRMPYAMQITEVRASLTSAAASGVVTVDINLNGTSIFGNGETGTRLTIDSGERTSTTAATAFNFASSAALVTFPDDAEVRVDIDTVGTESTGKGLKVTLIGYQR